MILRKANITIIDGDFNEAELERLIPNFKDFGDEPSDADSAGDYLLGITMILAFLISTALNPFTFLFNYHQDGRLKTTRVLFMLLAISDFLTNIYRPLQIGYRFLSPEVYPFVRVSTVADQVEALVFKFFMFSSLILTTFISICRFINVKFPFYKLSGKVVMMVITISILGCMLIYYSVTVGIPRKSTSYFYLLCQMTSAADEPITGYLWFIIQNVLVCILGAAGVLSSLLTVNCLMNKKGRTSNEESTVTLCKSSQAVLIMNIGNAVMIAIQVAYSYYGSQAPLINVLGAFGMAVILSALNPLMRICLCQEIKDFILKRCRKMIGHQ